MSDCLSDAELNRLRAHDMSDGSQDRARRHLEACGDCRSRDQKIAARHEKLLEAGRQHFASGLETFTAIDPSEDGRHPVPDLRIEGYQLLRELGRGGQGVVYQALQLATRSKVAIKVLLHGSYASESARRRFEREIAMVAQLRHPGIISVHDSGVTPDGRLYYVMEYLRGLPLTEYIRESKLTLQDTLALFGKICDAVQFAHQRGVIHRDLKPSNVRVDVKGNIKLLDFGLARWVAAPGETLSQAVIGTLPYMSPEQTRGNPDEIDTRSDIYALGVMLYETLTGHFPYPVTQNMAETIRHIAESPPTPPSRQWTSDSGVTRRSDRRLRPGSCPIDDEVQTVVLKALAKEPERRYQSAGELAGDLRRYLQGDAIEAKRDSKLYLLKVSLRRNRKTCAAVAAIVLLLAAVSGAEVRRRHNEKRALGERLRAADLQRLVADAIAQNGVGKYAQAVSLFDDALALDPDSFEALKHKAFTLRFIYLNNDDYGDHGQLAEARALCTHALQIQPDDHALHNLRGTLCMLDGDLEGARVALNASLELKPEFFHAASNMAKMLALQGRFQEALQTVQAGIVHAEEQSDIKTNHSDGIWLTLGTLQLFLEDPEAMTSLQHAVALDEEDHRDRLLLARALLQQGHAAAGLEQAKLADLYARANPHDPRVSRILALACLESGEYEDAARHAEAAMRGRDLPAFGHLIKSLAYSRLHQDIAARNELEEAQRHWPEFQDGVLVNVEKEVLWIDSEEELRALNREALEQVAR